MPDPSSSSIIVITGASSGIGRATALECARRGATVVVAARRSEPLDTLVSECRRLGGEALAVPTDVTDPAAVEALGAAAVEAFGRFDAWVSAAGVYLVGPFEDTPAEAFRRVVEVDLMGVVHGARVALAQFRRQGRGVLVNVSSLAGGLAAPQITAYAAAKWGVRGFSHSLRAELRDAPDIHVCVVRPAAIDTPIFRVAGNVSGRPLKALTPTYPPELVAGVVAGLLEHPRREVVVGSAGRLLAAAHAVAPLLLDGIFARQAESDQFAPGTAERTDGNLFTPDPSWTATSGAWPTTNGGGRRAGLAAALVALGGAAGLLTWRRGLG